MAQMIVLGAFAAALLGCIACDLSILYALGIGYALFFGYGLAKGHGAGEMLRLSWQGVRKIRNILIVFGLIGMITAVWRACATVPMFICEASRLIVPQAFLLISFLLNCLMSFLTGTAFGTAATVGVITMSIGTVMGVQPAFLGGAILSGVFFGDRCSPMSTSALLVCELTGTDIYRNIRRMTRTALVPFLLSCGVYFALGMTGGGAAAAPDVLGLFAGEMRLGLVAMLPAALVVALSLLRVNVKWTMLASIAAGCVLCLSVQGMAPGELAKTLILGYKARDPRLSAMLDGGGILSMLKVAAIVGISSSYSGMFDGTGLLDGLKGRIEALSHRLTPFGGVLITSLAAAMVACNQTLAIMLTHQLCGEVVPEREEMAIALEDSAVVVSALVPWSIAGAVPLATIGAPAQSILFACYLYLLPVCHCLFARRWARLNAARRPAA